MTSFCVSTLDGTGLFSSSLTGSSTFCDFSSEGYSVNLINPPQDVQYTWSLPAGATIISGNNTGNVVVAFGNSPGTVSVTIVTPCGTTTYNQAVTNGACEMYRGDDNDGFSQGPSCVTTLDGAPLTDVAPSIVGSTDFCNGSFEAYSIEVTNAPANVYYNWIGPAGSVVVQGQGTSVATIQFAGVAGNISVDVITDCSTTNRTMAVSPMSCPFYAGGDSDGADEEPACSTTLDGAPTYSVVRISGSSAFCEFGNETFTVVTNNAPANTYYDWTIPVDATILSGQGTATILVAFGNTNGNIGVTLTTDCSVVTPSTFPVVATSCSFYAGGDNDGFSNVLGCATKLDGTQALVPGPINGPTTYCEFATESYSINPQGANIETTYVWSVPVGATILSGQGTTTILVGFTNSSGNISVDVSNPCTTINVSQAVTSTSCTFYAGGNNDGFSSTPICIGNLDGGSAFIAGPIVGVATACNLSSETYSITVAGALPGTIYNWTVPPGATIISGQGTTSVFVSFGNTSGNIAVAITNECETVNVSLPITVANCIFYAGGNNDGFSQTRACTTNLNGGSQFIPGPITGSASFCTFSSEQYSIAVAGATSATTYTWSVPGGSSIVSGQGTTTILVSLGSGSGNVAVTVTNECESIVVTLPVTGSSCIFYSGGSNDGFSVTTITNMPLPISLVSFDASVNNGIVNLTWETSSEQDNDFFIVERSRDGQTFETLTKIDGAGTTTQALKYQAKDTNPFKGTSYYRLSQTDFDGATSYYKVLSIKIDGFPEVTRLYPNPVDKEAQLHVDFFAEEDGPVKISIVDPAGLSTESGRIEVKAGANLFEFTPHFKSSGVHVIIIRTRDKAQALRLVVL